MIAWRISHYADLKGLGGQIVGGRWHSAGHPIVYLADHAASAMLEMLVHSELSKLPANFPLLKVSFPDHCVMELDVDALNPGWQNHLEETQYIGDRWLSLASSAILKVPSALAVDGYNFLLNPLHQDAHLCRIEQVITAPLDGRLR
ncbi:RES family NAD+ phosphorylase [Neisseriaceae bacterium TC5R-5]|nr:RES family NAD+ phosphorylase [Neisseriaceae bacterium TC5R-5]